MDKFRFTEYVVFCPASQLSRGRSEDMVEEHHSVWNGESSLMFPRLCRGLEVGIQINETEASRASSLIYSRVPKVVKE
jgi:hypothetical protein